MVEESLILIIVSWNFVFNSVIFGLLIGYKIKYVKFGSDDFFNIDIKVD